MTAFRELVTYVGQRLLRSMLEVGRSTVASVSVAVENI